ncbi:hypothetical protein ALC53_02085, partial [Atta colombica]
NKRRINFRATEAATREKKYAVVRRTSAGKVAASFCKLRLLGLSDREYGGETNGRTLVRISRSQANPILFRVTSAGSSMKRQYFPMSARTEENAMASKIEATVAGLQLQPVADLQKRALPAREEDKGRGGLTEKPPAAEFILCQSARKAHSQRTKPGADQSTTPEGGKGIKHVRCEASRKERDGDGIVPVEWTPLVNEDNGRNDELRRNSQAV